MTATPSPSDKASNPVPGAGRNTQPAQSSEEAQIKATERADALAAEQNAEVQDVAEAEVAAEAEVQDTAMMDGDVGMR
ncbi:hypothetical protein [Oecophyllibacter saccharovorans]|uniref:Uncharacterized protein n=1 Tax=Oecophyllibacter saccharovorans TaxID=2558360 RepID=A0A506UMC2_9PROT|nr:hypothetical protein [Oecophyllibacter saccharovorans]TPW34333.1 hypothetical protein E3202_07525 [Oecophyllibacter saccharovorans]TPW36519.1 hypothetical protein E3203_01755 [Oecophyllibacter saccharovorans]